ncbi:MAG TPA: hypothetical protein V6D28_17800 [Leptolyngbyaceae cyanobacterium]
MRFKTFAAVILAAPLCLVPSVRAENSLPLRGLIKIESPEPSAQSDWNEFLSTSGRFAVSMPGQPKEEIATADDGSLDYSFSLRLPRGAYFIHYTDIPKANEMESEKLQALLDRVPADFVSGAQATLKEDPRNVEINGYPGKEFYFTLKTGLPGVGRVYMVQERLYLLLAMTNQSEDTQKFVNSFRLL